MSERSGKAEDKKNERSKKPPGYRNFEKLLKQVVKAPPLRDHPLRSSPKRHAD